MNPRVTSPPTPATASRRWRTSGRAHTPRPARTPPAEAWTTDGEQGADHDLLRADVGPVVQAVRADVDADQEQHGAHRQRDPHSGRHGESLPAPPAEHQPADGRPHQVELLFDGQRPGVQERGDGSRLLEVALIGQHEMPVGHIGQRGEGVPPEAGQRVRLGEPGGIQRHQGDQHQEAGQQTPGPPGVERAEPERAGRRPLLEQQGRDEETREDEEDVHPQEPAAGARHPEVEEQDDGHGQGPDPVETRDIATLAHGVLGHRSRSGRLGPHDRHSPPITPNMLAQQSTPTGDRPT